MRHVPQEEADAIVCGVMNLADKLDPRDIGREYPKMMIEVEVFLQQTLPLDVDELLKINSEGLELVSVWKETKKQGIRRFLKTPFTSIRFILFNLFVFQLSKRVLAKPSQRNNILEQIFWWLARKLHGLFSNFHYSLCPQTLTFDGTMDLFLAGAPGTENVLKELYSEIFGSQDCRQAIGVRGKVLRRYADLETHLPNMNINRRVLPKTPGFLEEAREFVNCAYYRGELASVINKTQHLGIIMDGNRRYSKSQGFKNILLGHQVGAHKLIQVVSWAFSSGISNLTVWALSDDNLKRGPQELNPLFSMMADYIQEIMLNDAPFSIPAVRFRVVGDRSIIPAYLNTIIDKAEAGTSHNTKFNLQLAIGYGGRSEIILATKLAITAKAKKEGLAVSKSVESITEEDISNQLYSSRIGLPRIDAILRTSGENRLSGFALWESHHAEFAIISENWPALKQSTFLRALLDLSGRNRRLGV
jgi:short-chain Z-isoprenyl diphosphate synthase